MYDNTSRIIEVNIDEILPSRVQPRIQFDEEEILELSDSIREHGVIQPIVVRRIGDKYEIVAGERRYKASVLAGMETVPVIVKDLNDKDSAEIALIENVQRKNLTPIEEALSYKRILDMGYMTQEDLAVKLGKSQSSIANKIRLLNLSDEVQEALLENRISERHARSLLKLETSKLQNEMLNRIINERLTVRRTDEEINKLKNVRLVPQEEYKEKVVQIKDIKEGEDYMNNNIYGSDFNPQNNSQIFGMFNNTATPTYEPMQVNNSVQNEAPSFPTFDIFAEPQNSVGQVEGEVKTPVVEQQEVKVEPVYNPFVVASTPDVSINNETQNGEMPEYVAQAPTYNYFNVSNTSEQSVNNEAKPEIEVPKYVQEQPQVSNQVQNDIKMPEYVIPKEQVSSVPEYNSFYVEPNQTVNNSVQEEVTVANVPNEKLEEASEQPHNTETPDFSSFNFFDDVNQGPSQGIQPVEPKIEPQNYNILSNNNVPETSPIIENVELEEKPINNYVEEVKEEPSQINVEQANTQPSIIVTDYSKQYDPVMPQVYEEPKKQVDFKDVINTIRECTKKIEDYGFKIDVDEYDLFSQYQVVFKIEK